MARRIAYLLLDLALLLAAVRLVVELGLAFSQRVTAQFDIEWMEGATLMTALRIVDGLPIYGEPAPDYIPFIYPPGYAAVVATLSAIFPMGYTLGRAVSIVGMLFTAAAVVVGARQEGARWPFALASVGLLASAYAEGGTFYDLIRVDALLLGLLAWSIVLVRRATLPAVITGALLLTLAFLTKHNAAMLGVPMALWLWYDRNWRLAATFAMCSALPALGFLGAMELAGEHLFHWLVVVPSDHGIRPERALPWYELKKGELTVTGAQAEVWRALPLTSTLLLLWPGWLRARGGLYWAGIAVTTLVMVSIMRGHVGGYINVLIPMFFVLSVLPAAQLGGLGDRPAARGLIGLVMLAQLFQGRDDLNRYVPGPRDRARAAAFVEDLRELPGPVLLPHAPYLAVLAGKPPSFALICLWDIDREGGPHQDSVRRIEALVTEGHWPTAILPDDKLGYGLKKGYERVATLKNQPPPTRVGYRLALRERWGARVEQRHEEP